MLVADLIACIEAVAPLAGACSWDTSGVQVTSPRTTVSRLAVMLDATPAQVQTALAWGAEAILAHHPLALKPRFLNVPDAYFSIIRSLLQADCWCYAAHTSLDARPEGPAGWLARELDLRELAILEPTLADGSAGIGCLGQLPQPLPWAEFLGRLAALLPRTCIRRCGPEPETVTRVGYCGGSGASLADLAFARGAQVFITGDVKYHTALDTAASAAGCLVDVGHFSIEEEMMRRFALLLAEHVPPAAGLAVRFFPGQDPFHTVHPGPSAVS
ncbi:Nif3-like dinuclear metal center hexameric protein [Megalodesulfovibrio paquesii]